MFFATLLELTAMVAGTSAAVTGFVMRSPLTSTTRRKRGVR
jgi:hypothetical protein